MTNTSKRVSQTNNDTMHDIEGRHFGRCVDQVWGAGRRTLIELMDYPKARCQAVVVKQYDTPVPKMASSKPWPDLISAYVYIPVNDESNTWAGLDAALSDYEADRRVKAIKSGEIKEGPALLGALLPQIGK